MTAPQADDRRVLAAIVLLGALARFAGLGSESFWHDEGWTAVLLEGSPATLLHRLHLWDAHPPLYFLLLQAWSGYGAWISESWLRLPSAILGTASILLIYRLGRELAGGRAGLLAALFLAASPYAIWYSREARSYALLLFLCLVSLNLLVDLRREGMIWKWVAFALVTGALLLTHYMNAFFIASQAAMLFLVRRDRPGLLKEFVLACALAALLFAPWLPVFADHARRVHDAFWIPAPTASVVGRSLGDLVVASGPVWAEGRVPLLALAFWGAALLAPSLPSRRETWALRLLLLIPPAGELLVSLRRPVFYTQTFQYILIPLLLLGAAAATRLGPARWAAGLLLLATMVPGLARLPGSLHKENWREAEARIAASIRPGERVIAVEGFLGANLACYGRLAVPRREWKESLRVIGETDMVHPPVSREAALREVREGAPGVWLIGRYGMDDGWKDALSDLFEVESAWESRKVNVTHLRRR